MELTSEDANATEEKDAVKAEGAQNGNPEPIEAIEKEQEQDDPEIRLKQKRERRQMLLKKNLDMSTRVFQMNMRAMKVPWRPVPRSRFPIIKLPSRCILCR